MLESHSYLKQEQSIYQIVCIGLTKVIKSLVGLIGAMAISYALQLFMISRD
jgi:hypothetical protein